MNSRFYIIMRRDLWDLSPPKAMAQAAHAQADFEAHLFPQSIPDAKEFCDAVIEWREQRNFGTTIILHETLETFGKISMNVAHWGYTTDSSYPYRNWYGEMFTRSEVTCMWVFAYTENELEYMRQFNLHK
jgi:hypothetical protein